MSNAITQFGERDEVRELAERVQKMLPGGQHYTLAEALTLAQISVAHNLDPFNGEVWLIKDEQSGKVYGALIGIKGHRKHAKLQANYWGIGANGGFERVTDPDKLAAYGAAPNSIVFEYKIMDEVTLAAYTRTAKSLIDVGVPMAEVQKMFGPPPVTLGVGVYTAGEKTKMKPAQCAMFRAEKDALKRRFDVQFRVAIEGHVIDVHPNGDLDDEAQAEEIEAEYETVSEPRDTDEVMAELGFDPGSPATEEEEPEPELVGTGEARSEQLPASANGKKHTPGEIYKAVVEAKLSENDFAAKAALTNYCHTGYDTPEKAIAWMRLYRGWKDSGKTTIEAATCANNGDQL